MLVLPLDMLVARPIKGLRIFQGAFGRIEFEMDELVSKVEVRRTLL
jgi:hypothetical protein